MNLEGIGFRMANESTPIPLAKMSNSGRATWPWSDQSESIPGFCRSHGAGGEGGCSNTLLPGLQSRQHISLEGLLLSDGDVCARRKPKQRTKSRDGNRFLETLLECLDLAALIKNNPLDFSVLSLPMFSFLEKSSWSWISVFMSGSSIWPTALLSQPKGPFPTPPQSRGWKSTQRLQHPIRTLPLLFR